MVFHPGSTVRQLNSRSHLGRARGLLGSFHAAVVQGAFRLVENGMDDMDETENLRKTIGKWWFYGKTIEKPIGKPIPSGNLLHSELENGHRNSGFSHETW